MLPTQLLIFMSSTMKISIWSIGKAHDSTMKESIEGFTQRLNRYFPAEWKIIPAPKINAQEQLKKAEARLVLDTLGKEDFLILLDEKGKMMHSLQVAEFLQNRANESSTFPRLVFLIGGAYGVDAEVRQKAKLIWSLSDLTFPHQLARLILVEQLYRACTILKNEKYHHT